MTHRASTRTNFDRRHWFEVLAIYTSHLVLRISETPTDIDAVRRAVAGAVTPVTGEHEVGGHM